VSEREVLEAEVQACPCLDGRHTVGCAGRRINLAPRARLLFAETETVEEFVGVGCCGDTLDVPLRLEKLVDGDRIDEGTEIVYETRER
jgi:hypothetical protein